MWHRTLETHRKGALAPRDEAFMAITWCTRGLHRQVLAWER